MTLLRLHDTCDLPSALERLTGLGAKVLFEIPATVRFDHLRETLAEMGLYLAGRGDASGILDAAPPAPGHRCANPGCRAAGTRSRDTRGNGPFYCSRHWEEVPDVD